MLSPQAANFIGYTPLHTACRLRDVEAVRRLVMSEGADARAAADHTPLHIAVTFGAVSCVKTLLAAGADVNAKNKHGNTPLHLAHYHGRPEIVRLLLAAGADESAVSSDGRIPSDLTG